MSDKKERLRELNHLAAILRICSKNAPTILKEQNERIANKIKDLIKVHIKKRLKAAENKRRKKSGKV